MCVCACLMTGDVAEAGGRKHSPGFYSLHTHLVCPKDTIDHIPEGERQKCNRHKDRGKPYH